MKPLRFTRTGIATFAMFAAVVLVFAWMAWMRRWIADDGLIVVRVVSQLLAGNGPTFNEFERCESNTSTVWTFLLAFVALFLRGTLALVTIKVGWVLAVGSLIVAFSAATRFQRRRGANGVLVPVGGAAVCALYPFWDYATSGLETGLCWFWIAWAYWFLATLHADSSRRRQLVTALVFGLGPLVRPDFAVISATFLVAMWLVVRPSRKRLMLIGTAAGALPVAYEVFRAGYYGILVPMPALTKSASGSEWGRGLLYLQDFGHPFHLWFPLALLMVTFVFVLYRRIVVGRDRVVVLAPLIAGALLTIFVVKVGGDFMHGRMMTSPFLLAMLPVFVLPIRRLTLVPIVGVVIWSIVIGWSRNDDRFRHTSRFVNDERLGYRLATGKRNPIFPATFIRMFGEPAARVTWSVLTNRRLLITESGMQTDLDPQLDAPIVFVVGRLGTGGLVAPLDGIVGDVLGLANPIGARIEITNPDDMPGHQKVLPTSWLIAAFADPSIPPADGSSQEAVEAARRAMRCGELAELLASVREPMTPGRFWENLTGSVRRTFLTIPSDPRLAEAKFCSRP